MSTTILTPQTLENLDTFCGINLEVVLPEIVESDQAVKTDGGRIVVSSHLMVTRSKIGSLKPKVFVNNVVRGNIKEPTSVTESISDEGWYNAMKEEFQALKRNQTWKLALSSKGMSVVDHKWVHKTKLNAYCTLHKLKPRLVAKGFQQVLGVDYVETFSPVVKDFIIRVYWCWQLPLVGIKLM